MTVCIAVRSDEHVILVSDRMISARAMEYEPFDTKIEEVTSRIAIMYSGDANYFGEVIQEILMEVRERGRGGDDLTVRNVAHLWQKHYTNVRYQHAEPRILSPYGLDRKTYVEKMMSIEPSLLQRLAEGMANFKVPSVEVIIAGLDGRHGGLTPSIWQGLDDEVICVDQMAFVAIGTGGSQAEAQLMVSKFHFSKDLHEAILDAYIAKKKSEVAPGVGVKTDLVQIGPENGIEWFTPKAISMLSKEYSSILAADEAALEKSQTFVKKMLFKNDDIKVKRDLSEDQEENDNSE